MRSRPAPVPEGERARWPADRPLAITLLVRVDEGEGVLRPSVQVRGTGEPRHARIRLELVDPDDLVRLTVKRRFPAAALNAELPLPAFAPPPGAGLDELLGWSWVVVLSGERGELRWRERPRPAGALNVEAELEREVRARDPIYRRLAGEANARTMSAGWAGSSRALLRKRALRMLLALALIAYVVVMYSGPAGEVSAIRALLLYVAFAAIWVALWALGTALFASEEELPGDRRLDRI